MFYSSQDRKFLSYPYSYCGRHTPNPGINLNISPGNISVSGVSSSGVSNVASWVKGGIN